ncbi:MAG TPA: polysaccharide biosynthesis/export family protein [Longimicrobium sp.]
MRTRLTLIAALVLAAAPLAGQGASAQTTPPRSEPRLLGRPVGEPAPPPPPAPAPALAAGDVVRPGDVIKLRIWQEPDLSGEFPVNEQGTAVLPKVGPMNVAGITQDELRRQVTAAYTRYLAHNVIDVTLLRRIQVLGSVRNPGLYPVDGTMTVADVLALAGGVAPEGRRNQVQLIRGGQRMDIRLTGGERLADTPIRSGDQLFVQQRSWADRNTGTLVGIVTTGVGLLVGLLTR